MFWPVNMIGELSTLSTDAPGDTSIGESVPKEDATLDGSPVELEHAHGSSGLERSYESQKAWFP